MKRRRPRLCRLLVGFVLAAVLSLFATSSPLAWQLTDRADPQPSQYERTLSNWLQPIFDWIKSVIGSDDPPDLDPRRDGAGGFGYDESDATENDPGDGFADGDGESNS